MAEESNKPRKRLLDPSERLSEILFGLIMVLTFTCSFSAAHAGRSDVREMLLAALGCNLAWGIIDAVFYLMGCFSELGHNLITFRAVRKAADPSEGQRIIGDAIPPVLVSVLPAGELELMRQKLIATARTAGACPTGEGRLAGSRGRVPAGFPLDISGGGSIYVVQGYHPGAAYLKRCCYRDVVCERLRVCRVLRAPSVEDRDRNGGARRRNGGSHDSLRRIKETA